ncbi:MAG TPA: lytic transglycosylase domain-containing protein [Terriglobales bacterium]|nr:lytic transglycosylase domain-containing protein [Terriglobales bacterium]
MILNKKLRLAISALLVFFASCSFGAELAILRNGNSIKHERREVIGTVTRLYLSNSSDGYIEIPTEQIDHFEMEDPIPGPSQPQSTEPMKTAQPDPPIAATQPAIQLTPSAVDRTSLNSLVSGAGQRHQLDPDFINSVIRAESGFNSRAVSRKGAQGLMQLMPQTASQLGVANAFDPKANVDGGTKYLRELLEKYNYDVPKALAAYNAGSRRVDRYHGVPPYFETQTYVAKIIRDYNRKKLAENPSLAHKSKSPSGASKSAKNTQKLRPKTAAVNSSLRGTETASR